MCGGTFILGIMSTLVAGAIVMFFILGANNK
jgi:hypothetical protein